MGYASSTAPKRVGRAALQLSKTKITKTYDRMVFMSSLGLMRLALGLR